MPLDQRQGANNPTSKSTSPTWIKFDIHSKSGVKLSNLALVDPTLGLNLMSYGTWVLFGQPTLNLLEKPSLEYSEFLGKCIGLVHQTIHLNSRGVTHKYVSVARGFNRRSFLNTFLLHFL